MEILYDKKEIKNVIFKKARYQKVMVLFDDFVSNLEIDEIYQQVKELCVFNKCSINKVDCDELNNGYKILIFICCVDSYLKLCYNKADFINIFIPKDNAIMPYFLNSNYKIEHDKDYLFLSKSSLDVGVISSINFNQFASYVSTILNFSNEECELDFSSKEITQANIMGSINNYKYNFEFLDVCILKKCNIEYDKLIVLDLILIDALFLFVMSIKNNSVSLIDVYKECKNDYDLIDKFYAMANNKTLTDLIILNFNSLYKYCLNKREKIINCLAIDVVTKTEVVEIIEKVKEFAKQDNGLLSYLYLFNVFDS